MFWRQGNLVSGPWWPVVAQPVVGSGRLKQVFIAGQFGIEKRGKWDF
jgi:hypothetical protein